MSAENPKDEVIPEEVQRDEQQPEAVQPQEAPVEEILPDGEQIDEGEESPHHKFEPLQETLIARFPKEGRVEVVSNMEMKNGDKKLETVPAGPKHRPSYYNYKQSSVVASFLAGFTHNNEPVEFFRVLAERAEEVVGLIAQADRPELDAISRERRVYSSTLDRVKYDMSALPVAELKQFGIDPMELIENGDMSRLERGLPPRNLYRADIPGSKNISVGGDYSLNPVRKEDGSLGLELVSPLTVPEWTDPELSFTNNEKETLRRGYTLDHIVKFYDEEAHRLTSYFVAGDPLTGRIAKVPVVEVDVPDFINGARLNDAQKKDLGNAGRIRVDGCYYGDKTNRFWGFAQYDVMSGEFRVNNPHYEHPYLSKRIRQFATDEQQKKLLAGEAVDAKNIPDNFGIKHRRAYVDPETNTVVWDDKEVNAPIQSLRQYADPAPAQRQGQRF